MWTKQTGEQEEQGEQGEQEEQEEQGEHARQTWHKHIGVVLLVLTTQSTHTNQCPNLNLENHNHHVFSCMLFQ